MMSWIRCGSLLALALLWVLNGCDGSSEQGDAGPNDGTTDAGADASGLPESLPFEFTRDDVGEAVTATQVTDFTRAITGAWKEVDYFRWCSWHSHGLDASFDPEMPDYKLYWQDTRAIKEGDTITFEHYGGADNLMIRTSKVLAQAASGYLMSGDPLMGELVAQYAKGMVALFLGMVWGNEDPPITSIMARAIFTLNHSYSIEEGRNVVVDYDPAKVEKYDWNAHTIPNSENPTWGDIWVRNMRSKDDLPHIFRAAPLLLRVAEDGQDEHIREAARTAYEYLQAFARDIVDNTYLIRTKGIDGVPYVPMEEDNPDSIKDLACLRCFEAVLPNAECDAKLTTALVAYGEPLENACENGISPHYEAVATAGHYFNYAIVRYFHLAAITNALTLRQDTVAGELLAGLAQRTDEMMADETERLEHGEWDADMASFLVAAAASGLPLTSAEVHKIHDEYGASATHYVAWPNWDLWDASIPDGTYDYKPSRNDGERTHVRPEELAYFLQYCYSPWRNPAGVQLIDCEVVADPSRWGE
ncbi:MAG: hypothetical protein JRF33_02935 [Deltaproteobacteria bacterium]|nr:hypothetical protein [Deltaproteobacteria bacterium]